MLRYLIAALCLLATSGMAQDLSNDPRLKQAVGRLDMGHTGFCTGALVSHDIVLTAAHCMFDKTSGQKFDVEQLTFQPGLKNGKSAHIRAVQDVFVHPKFEPAKKGDLSNLPFDLALVKLERPLSKAISAPFSVAYPNLSGMPASVFSYGKGRADNAEVQQGCQLSSHAKGIYLTTCRANAGTSGAPVIQMRNGQPAIVSIVSAMARADGTPVSLVVPVADAFASMHEALAGKATPARFETD